MNVTGKALFITGTGTDVGKTFACGLLVRTLRRVGYDVGYYKAAISGAETDSTGTIQSDASFVAAMAGLTENHDELVSFSYRTSVSPHLAARIEGHPPEMETIIHDFLKACTRHKYIVVEGSGGIACPLRVDKTSTIMLEDVVKTLGLDVAIVADAGLGTLNALVTTCAYLEKAEIKARGFILNRFERDNIMHEDNLVMAQRLTKLPSLALISCNANSFDISSAKIADRILPLFKSATL